MTCRPRFRLRRPDDDFLRAPRPPLRPFAVVQAGTQSSWRRTIERSPRTFHEHHGRMVVRNLCEMRSPLSFAQSRATGFPTLKQGAEFHGERYAPAQVSLVLVRRLSWSLLRSARRARRSAGPSWNDVLKEIT